MKQTYYLTQDDNGCVCAKFEVEKAESHYVTGSCFDCISWSTDNEPYEWQFLADVSCKWDACTHWNFYGEDYDGTLGGKEDADSYYHLCSAYGFNQHIRMMCFVWKVVCTIMSELSNIEDPNKFYDSIPGNYFELEKTEKLVELMLDGYIITTNNANISSAGKLEDLKIGG